MANIFLSYNRESQAVIGGLVRDLEELDYSVWFDQNLNGGQAWWDKILLEILECDFFLFVLAEASLHSTACQRECSYAASLGKAIIPILMSENVSTNILPPELSRIQFIDYRKRDPEAIIKLSRALRSSQPSMQLPDPLPDPPEVPISYLGSLSQKIDTPSHLSEAEQSTLILDLKRALRDASLGSDSLTLLKRLRLRRDLLASMAAEIDDMIDSQSKAQAQLEIPNRLLQEEDFQKGHMPFETNRTQSLPGQNSSSKQILEHSPKSYIFSFFHAVGKSIAARPFVSGALAFILIFFTWCSSLPDSGVKLANNMDKYAIEYISKHNILMPSEKLIAYYDATTAMNGTEAAILTNQRVIYHKNYSNSSINLADIADVKYRSESLGDSIEIFSKSGEAMKIDVALWNGGDTLKSALLSAWNKAKSIPAPIFVK